MSGVAETTGATPEAILAQLSDIAERVLVRCKTKGARQAEVGLNQDRGLAVNVRVGEVETLEYTHDRGLSLTVFFDQRKGSASTADLDPASIETTIEQACAIARYTEADPYAGLADAERMATKFPDLDQWHPWEINADDAIDIALRCEQAGRDLDPRISNSDGASLSSGRSLSVYANSHGFIGRERGSSHSLSCALIAGRDEAMQRDYWYTASCHPGELQDAATVGRRAAERAIARLQPGAVQTGRYPVLFAPEVARSLFGHLLSAVSGSALYRRASFLLDSMGTQVLPNWLSLRERPFLLRGQRSAAFDAEGVATCDSDLVHEGVLSRYVLGSYSARKLGLQSTANAGGVHNLLVQGRGESFETLLGSMSRGLLVTELMGQGVSTLTGDYSRGAAGFWVESGQIAWPVDEATIAGNLRDMFMAIEAVGSDVDTRSHLRTGSVLIGQMTVAGAAD